MSETAIRDRTVARELGAYVVAARYTPDGRLAFALGDGTIRRPASDWDTIEVADGAVLAMVATEKGWITGADDGRLRAIDGSAAGPDAVRDIATFGSKWVEQVAAWGGLVACGVGKTVHLFRADGAGLKQLAHPSTVTGVAFDAKGKRIAASHYDGATLWFVGAKVDSPRTLAWKGSHIGVAMHPGGDAVVTAMQEKSLHGWRLADGQHMRMSGYPAKTASLAFSRTGKWLASSGAESIVLWPFFGGGPMGKAPLELAGGDAMLCTQVAFHPQQDMVAAGFADGLVVVADVASERVLPVASPRPGAITALAWSPDGSRLAFGTETGFAAVVDLSKRD